jgi:uncharacterized membrane protein
MLQAAKHVRGGVMWANLHLLFWLSLTPFGTHWLGETGIKPLPVATYGFILLMSGVAYYILEKTLIHSHGKDSALAKALGIDPKGIISVVIYATAIVVANFVPQISCALYVLVAIMWLVPDKRIERILHEH